MKPPHYIVRNRLKWWLEALLGFFYPEVCHYCGQERATARDGYVGAQCRKHATFIQPPMCERCGLPFAGAITESFHCANCHDVTFAFSTARSAVVAQGMVLDLLHRYKYHQALWVEPFLVRLFIQAAGQALSQEPWDMIVPVPLHPTKHAEREFNQAERLARPLGKALSLPVHDRILKRIRPTDTQTQLSRRARQRNVQYAFALCDPAPAQPRRVVLVDDVFTTGATTNACARLLREAGASHVCVWTLARGLFH